MLKTKEGYTEVQPSFVSSINNLKGKTGWNSIFAIFIGCLYFIRKHVGFNRV